MSPRTCTRFKSAQIAACAMHRSGALLLEPRDGDLLDERLQRCAVADGAAPSQATGASSHMHHVRSRHVATIWMLANQQAALEE